MHKNSLGQNDCSDVGKNRPVGKIVQHPLRQILPLGSFLPSMASSLLVVVPFGVGRKTHFVALMVQLVPTLTKKLPT